MHFASEEDAEWLRQFKIAPYNEPNRFIAIFSENGTRLLYLGVTIRGDKLTISSAGTDSSIRNTGYLKEIGADAIAWLERENIWNVNKLYIPVKQKFDCLFEGFQKGAIIDNMRIDVKVL